MSKDIPSPTDILSFELAVFGSSIEARDALKTLYEEFVRPYQRLMELRMSMKKNTTSSVDCSVLGEQNGVLNVGVINFFASQQSSHYARWFWISRRPHNRHV